MRGLDPFFRWICRHPRGVAAVSALLFFAAAVFLPALHVDTRADAFLAPDNPALVYRETVKEQFGLSDPIVVALVSNGENGMYEPAVLQLIARLSDQIAALPNINADRVMSLATVSNITSSQSEILIEPFLQPMPQTDEELARLRQSLDAFPVYLGSIVAKNRSMALITAELVDEAQANRSYKRIFQLVESLIEGENIQVHVAGEGAIAGYLGDYINADAFRLNPLAGLVINLVVILAFRRLNPALMCSAIIAGSVLITLGVMSAAGIPFFVITSALPVILIGISIADAIHVYSHYYTLLATRPGASQEDIVVDTMTAMYAPITMTTITTICGFLGLYLAGFMPPFKYFGLFAAFGVFIAWLYSMFFLPAALMLTRPGPSRYFHNVSLPGQADVFSRAVLRLGGFSLRHRRLVVMFAVVVAAGGGYAASQLVIDEDRIDLFHPSEPIYRADRAINDHMNGTNALDIVVEADAPEGLLERQALEKIEALQVFAESLPHVGGSVSIVDYLKQLNAVLNDGPDDYRLPAETATVAQYLLLYSALGDPTDFEEEIDYDYRLANVRVSLREGSYLAIKDVVEPLQHYIDQSFAGSGLTVTLSGRVAVNYHWFKDLGKSHFAGLTMALLMVWVVAAALFRSALAGLFALIPVSGAVLLVYAAMVLAGTTLGIGSSMFAAVAIGLGVDFSIHTLSRLKSLTAEAGGLTDGVFEEFYRGTGRALLFNFLAVACGFGVLISSRIVSLNSFGSIVVLAVSTSFIASLTLLPALIKMTQPSFILGNITAGERGAAEDSA